MYIVHNEDLSKKAYDALKLMILNGKLKPGTKLYQEKIADDLGISRTPLNGALNQLEKEMLVESLPRRGFYVKELTLNELSKLYQIRLRLDPLCANEAASNRNQILIEKCRDLLNKYNTEPAKDTLIQYFHELYNLIITMSENTFLKNMMISYNLISLINLQLFMDNDIIRKQDLNNFKNYKNILSAIIDNRPSEAELAMHNHILNIYTLLAEAIETQEK